MGMGPKGLETKSDCAGEDQKQINGLLLVLKLLIIFKLRHLVTKS
jgi:hypothetical protein